MNPNTNNSALMLQSEPCLVLNFGFCTYATAGKDSAFKFDLRTLSRINLKGDLAI